MYCPRCGQEQVSHELRFCSRCGLLLNLVTELVNNGGTLPQLAELNQNKSWLTLNFGLKIGLSWFLVIDFLLVPLAAITDAPGELVAFLAVVGFIGGLLIALLSFLFLKNETKNNVDGIISQIQTAQNLNLADSQQGRNALPPQQTTTVNEFVPPSAHSWKSLDTDNFARPSSVTEETTKLLEKDFEK